MIRRDTRFHSRPDLPATLSNRCCHLRVVGKVVAFVQNGSVGHTKDACTNAARTELGKQQWRTPEPILCVLAYQLCLFANARCRTASCNHQTVIAKLQSSFELQTSLDQGQKGANRVGAFRRLSAL